MQKLVIDFKEKINFEITNAPTKMEGELDGELLYKMRKLIIEDEDTQKKLGVFVLKP